MKIKLDTKYQAEIDDINEEDWSKLLHRFNDANIYQSWQYGAIRWNQKNLSHVVLKKNDKPVSIAQLRVIKLPRLSGGIAYLRWGPLWRLHAQKYDSDILSTMLQVLRDEYTLKRKLLLRILPNEIHHPQLLSIFRGKSYKWKRNSHRTIMLDLRPSLNDLRRNFTSRWRRQLNISERNNLQVVEGTEHELFDHFIQLYEEMLKRKKFIPGMNPYQYREMQKGLSENLKLNILICQYDKKPIAGIITSDIGDTCIYLLGATGDSGLNLRGSYLLHWKMIIKLKEKGIQWYDLNGYNPDKNPGTATFKEGFSGDVIHFLGQFESCQNLMSRIGVKFGETFAIISNKFRS
jgi:lipid II:glycine glycyltransferase (peptidoglycan interpeptide bridge formation enzyme)